MHFLKLLPLALLPTAFASPLAKRDAALVAQDVEALTARVGELNDAVVAYQGGNEGLIDAFKIQQASSAVSDAINKTTTDANASAPWNDDESTPIAIGLLNLQPDITTVLDNLQDKRDEFDSGFFPLSPIVLQTLKDQRAASQELGTAITAKLSPPFAAAAPDVIRAIDDKFAETIAVYESGSPFPGFPGGGR